MTIRHGADLTPEEFKALVAVVESLLRTMIDSLMKEKSICHNCTIALIQDVVSDLELEYNEKEVKDVRH
jgi:hypothetical protein